MRVRFECLQQLLGSGRRRWLEGERHDSHLLASETALLVGRRTSLKFSSFSIRSNKLRFFVGFCGLWLVAKRRAVIAPDFRPRMKYNAWEDLKGRYVLECTHLMPSLRDFGDRLIN